MASILQSHVVEISHTSKLASLGCVDSCNTRNLQRSSFAGKASVSSTQNTDCKLLFSAKILKPSSKQASHFLTSCVATSLDTNVSSETSGASEIGFDERRKASDDYAASKPYIITEVETIGQQEFNPATVTAVNQIAPTAKCITVNAEVSRELVALEKAYTTPGQTVQVKLSNGDIVKTLPSSPPFPLEANDKVLLKLRGDIPAGTNKLPQISLSVRMPLDLHVPASSPLYNLQPGDEISVGSFEGGLDLRPILFLARFPTLLIFVEGEGISVARAILEASDVGSLYLNMRKDIRLYYSAEKPSDLAYPHLHEEWAKKVNFRPTVQSKGDENWEGSVGTFAHLFDEDDLEYDPETTAAVVCVSSSQKDKVTAVLNDAGIDMKQVLFADV